MLTIEIASYSHNSGTFTAERNLLESLEVPGGGKPCRGLDVQISACAFPVRDEVPASVANSPTVSDRKGKGFVLPLDNSL